MADHPSNPAELEAFVPTAPEPEPVPTEAVPMTSVLPGSSRPAGAGWVNVALAIAIAMAIGGIGFAAGRMTAPSTLPVSAAGSGPTFGNGTGPGGGGFGGFGGDDGGFRRELGSGASVQGTVQSVSNGVLTLKLASGGTIQIALNGTTTYHSQAAATSSDVQAGGTVIVRLQLVRGQGTATPQATDVTIVP